jgi:thioredoxin-dependent peroxiredoxin
MKRLGQAGLLALTAALGTALAATTATAQETVLNIGDRAPIFEARSDDGGLWRSRENVGRSTLVVYFYPAAMTAGCTTQACTFRDNRSVLQELDAAVVGVSGDRVDALRTFKGANRLNFPLLSDTTGVIARAFGVPIRDGGTITREVEGQNVDLTRDVTMARWTFVIDRNGRIVYNETDVDPAGDPEAVINFLRRMRAEE